MTSRALKFFIKQYFIHMIMTSMIQLRIQLFSLQVIINSYQNKSHLTVNTVSTLTGLVIDLIDNFGIMNMI